jgi:FkbM family methyltransferase
VRRRVFEFFGNPRYSRPSLNELDRKIEKYLDYDGGFFLEAGANDGYAQSNTYYLEKFRGWQGVLVEAVPELYARCVRERKRCRVYNCALVAADYAESSIEVQFANLMSAVQGSFLNAQAQAEHISSGLTVQKLRATYKIKVPARTLDSILDELPGLVDIDFFSLDVENYEYNVLKGLSLTRYRPKYILVEARDFERVNGVLAPLYHYVEQMSHHDHLYRRRELT